MRVIGLMSGTSVDGIDAALVDIEATATGLNVSFLTGETYPYAPALRSQILDVGEGASLSMAELAELDDAIAAAFAQAALSIQMAHSRADLIGSHGQTVFHRPPDKRLGYSMQIGRGAAIAYLTKITTVSNFRAADIAAGGQGAPLVSAVDVALLSHPIADRCVQNIGGIGNVTYLPAQSQSQPSSTRLLGWDTGPGNMLLDLAVQQLSQGRQIYDHNGAWAATGVPCQPLVDCWLQQDFFQQPPPKSTGREHFGQEYLNQCWVAAQPYHLTDADLLATLTEFTAASIVDSYRRFLPQMPSQVLLCGGGSRNQYLRQRLQSLIGDTTVMDTNDAGVNADFKEAIAFAVLAYWRFHQIPGNLPEVTGASQPVLLGEIHQVI